MAFDTLTCQEIYPIYLWVLPLVEMLDVQLLIPLQHQAHRQSVDRYHLPTSTNVYRTATPQPCTKSSLCPSTTFSYATVPAVPAE